MTWREEFTSNFVFAEEYQVCYDIERAHYFIKHFKCQKDIAKMVSATVSIADCLEAVVATDHKCAWDATVGRFMPWTKEDA